MLQEVHVEVVLILHRFLYAQLEDVEQVAVPVNNHQITVRSKGLEVCTDALECVVGFFWCCGWHGSVAEGIS